jgi:hypothetical protein
MEDEVRIPLASAIRSLRRELVTLYELGDVGHHALRE